MNIIEALNLTKEKGEKVRPIGTNCSYFYESGCYLCKLDGRKYKDIKSVFPISDILSDWEVIKPNKEIQYKIDSMKFQIIRHCTDSTTDCRKCNINNICCKKQIPKFKMLDDWSLKKIVEAYHILKEAGDI